MIVSSSNSNMKNVRPSLGTMRETTSELAKIGKYIGSGGFGGKKTRPTTAKNNA
jgi:hypothetical protein